MRIDKTSIPVVALNHVKKRGLGGGELTWFGARGDLFVFQKLF